MEEAIRFEQVSKRFTLHHEVEPTLKQAFINALRNNRLYEEFWALKNLSFTIKSGEIVGIIGKNGSGKSTLLRLIAGIFSPDYGVIRLKGKVASFLDIGAGFHADFNGRENIFMFGTIMGLTTEQIEAAYEQIVDFSGLGNFIDVPLRNYSSGMGARLGFSVAANLNPDILLIDEVLAVGDFVFQQKCFNKLEEFKNAGKTIVMVSHSLTDLEDLCTRAICLHKGEVLIDGEVGPAIETYLTKTKTEDEWNREVLRRDEIMAARRREEQEREKARREREQFVLRIRTMEQEQEHRRKEDLLKWQTENAMRIAELENLRRELEDERLMLQAARKNYEDTLARVVQEHKTKAEELHAEYQKRDRELFAHYTELQRKFEQDNQFAKMEACASVFSNEWLGELKQFGRWGDRRAEIQAITFLNAFEQPITEIEAGEPMTIALTLLAHEPVVDPVVRLLIFQDSGYFLYGMNTARIKWPTFTLHGHALLRIRFPSVLILKGTYQFSIGIWPDEDLSFWENRPYDVHNFTLTLTITDNGCMGGGAIYLPSTWELTSPGGLTRTATFT